MKKIVLATFMIVAVAGLSLSFKARNPDLKIYIAPAQGWPCTLEINGRTTEPNANRHKDYEFASTTTTLTCGPMRAWLIA
ncbi:hypothetical protein DF947_10740 [Pedobacter paludis]|uniref:Uncharacterized protein n=1 Tax=Pedobacter paludis TaxID=2203212 RepID=A0A317F2G7_9SPHI|nr:hypothetical protein DF947_10740 [Pedobacter paludis]